MYDRDATDSMKKLVKIIESVLEKEKIEDYFKEDKEAFDYFIDSLFKEEYRIETKEKCCDLMNRI